jgi:hypothetical protein
MRILIIDEHEVYRGACAALLRTEGLEVVDVAPGDEVLALAFESWRRSARIRRPSRTRFPQTARISVVKASVSKRAGSVPLDESLLTLLRRGVLWDEPRLTRRTPGAKPAISPRLTRGRRSPAP